MKLTLDVEQEADGRFIAEVPELPGVRAYGATEEDAARLARVLAFRALADQIEAGELSATMVQTVSFDP